MSRIFRPQQCWCPPKTKLKFHPAGDEYKPWSKVEMDRVVEDMRDNGFDPRFPICLLTGKIVGGRNRYLAAQAAKVQFLTCTLPANTDAAKFVERENDNRRHENPEVVERRRGERNCRVVDARVSGQSIRTIAENENVSVATVQRAIAAATVSGDTVEPPDGKVIGKDLKSRASSKPQLYCPHCETLRRKSQPVKKGCEECKTLRKPKPSREELRAGLDEDNAKDPEPVDETIEDKIKTYNSKIEHFCRELTKVVTEFVNGNCPDGPWLRYQDRRGSALKHLKNACETFRTCKAPYVCPKCEGDGCEYCLKSGMMPKWKLDQTR